MKNASTVAQSFGMLKGSEKEFYETRSWFERELNESGADMTSYVKTEGKIIQIGSRNEANSITGTKILFDKIGNAVFNITDGKKKAIASILINKWMIYETLEEELYVYHTASKRMNKIYQIILGGGNQWYEGIYEFNLKGKTVDAWVEEKKGRKTLIIKSPNNYEAAMFKNSDGGEYSITRMDYNSDQEFKRAIAKTRLIPKDDLDIYFNPDSILRRYISKNLKKIEFC